MAGCGAGSFVAFFCAGTRCCFNKNYSKRAGIFLNERSIHKRVLLLGLFLEERFTVWVQRRRPPRAIDSGGGVCNGPSCSFTIIAVAIAADYVTKSSLQQSFVGSSNCRHH